MSFRDTFRNVIKVLGTPKMLRLVPQCLWTAISLSYMSGILVLEISCAIDNFGCGTLDPSGTNEKAMLAMVALGVGEMLGGQLIGQIIDFKGSKAACVANALLMVILTASTLTFLLRNEYNMAVFISTFMWGFQDSAVNTHSQEILGFEFQEEEQEP